MSDGCSHTKPTWYRDIGDKGGSRPHLGQFRSRCCLRKYSDLSNNCKFQLVFIFKSNSDTRTNSFSQWRKQNLNSSEVHPLCLPNKLLLLFTEGWKMKNSAFSSKSGKWLVFNPPQRMWMFPSTVELLLHLSANCSSWTSVFRVLWVFRVLSLRSRSENYDKDRLHCTDSLPQLQTVRSFIRRKLFASVCLQMEWGNMDRVSFA